MREKRSPSPLAIAVVMLVLGAPGMAPGAATTSVPLPAPKPAPYVLPKAKPEPPRRILSAGDYRLAREAFAAIENGNWSRARALAGRAEEPLAAKAIEWLYHLEPGSNVDFASRAAFIDGNPDWPRQRELLRRAEAVIPEDWPDALVLDWFTRHPPVSAEGRVRLGEALMGLGRRSEGIEVLRRAWIEGDFPVTVERLVLRRHGKLLSRADHEARLDHLLWKERRSAARRMLRRVGLGQRALAEARLRLMALSGGVDGAIARVPPELRDDPGLVYERLRWRRRKGLDESAREILFAPPRVIPNPEDWWDERGILARRALADGYVSEAYRLARDHGLSQGVAFAEGEWLAGWVALDFLRDPTMALSHFARLYQGVTMPVSRARGAYWAGRAAAALGDKEGARQWYRAAMAHPTTFYGQLAALKVEREAVLTLAPDPAPDPEAADAFEANELVRAARLLSELGEEERLPPFIDTLGEQASSAAQHAEVAALAVSLGRVDLGVRAAKRSVREGFLLAEPAYPVIGLPTVAKPERALLLAVSRQESAFNPRAVSGSGARGLMQLMPATAHQVARQLKVAYAPKRLTEDAIYNATLGGAYLAELLDRFDGSYVLSLAAYNAGPARVASWIKSFGDPRQPGVDPITWIEMIPYDETRNYVQRVLESLQIYRLRLNGTEVSLGLGRDLER